MTTSDDQGDSGRAKHPEEQGRQEPYSQPSGEHPGATPEPGAAGPADPQDGPGTWDAAAAGEKYSQPYPGSSPYSGYSPGTPGHPDPGTPGQGTGYPAPGPYPTQGNYPGQGTPPVPPETPQPSFGEARWGNFDVGYSLSQAWKGYTVSWVAWVSSMLLIAAVSILLVLVVFIPTVGHLTAYSEIVGASELPPPPAWMILLWVVTALGLSVLGLIWTLNCSRLAFRVVRGENIGILDFFRVQGLGKPFLVYLIVGLIIAVGSIAFYLPGIIAAFLLVFALPAAFQLRDIGVGQTLNASWKAVTANFGLTLAMVLIGWGLSLAGGIIIIGVLITTPLMYLFYAHAFQSIIGGPQIRRI